MNEYRVTVTQAGAERDIVVEAETAARAHDRAEDETGLDVVAVRFVRALGFSCRQRGSS